MAQGVRNAQGEGGPSSGAGMSAQYAVISGQRPRELADHPADTASAPWQCAVIGSATRQSRACSRLRSSRTSSWPPSTSSGSTAGTTAAGRGAGGTTRGHRRGRDVGARPRGRGFGTGLSCGGLPGADLLPLAGLGPRPGRHGLVQLPLGGRTALRLGGAGHRGVNGGRDRVALGTAVNLPVLAARAVPAGVEQHTVVAPGVAALLALRHPSADQPAHRVLDLPADPHLVGESLHPGQFVVDAGGNWQTDAITPAHRQGPDVGRLTCVGTLALPEWFSLLEPGQFKRDSSSAVCANLTRCRPTAPCVSLCALFPQFSPDCQTLPVAL